MFTDLTAVLMHLRNMLTSIHFWLQGKHDAAWNGCLPSENGTTLTAFEHATLRVLYA